VVEGVAAVVAQIEFVDAADAFAVSVAAATELGAGAEVGVVHADALDGRVVGARFAHEAVEGGGALGEHRPGFGDAALGGGADRGLPVFVDPNPAAAARAAAGAAAATRYGACGGVGGLAAGEVCPGLGEGLPMGLELPFLAVPVAAPSDFPRRALQGEVVNGDGGVAVGGADREAGGGVGGRGQEGGGEGEEEEAEDAAGGGQH